MKRKSLLFLMLMALFAPLAMNGQQTNTLLTEGFESSTLNTTYQATAWYSYNAGNGNNWMFGDMSYHNGSKCAYYSYNSTNAANCYMVSMPFNVNANMTRLSVSLYEKVASDYFPEEFEVFFVKASDVTTLSAVASATHYSAIPSASYSNEDWEEQTGYSTSSALAGQSVRVVVHCTSEENMYRLYIDDLTVTETISGGGQGGDDDNCAEIGTVNTSNYSYTYGPVNDYYKYSYYQIIYPKANVPTGSITSIGFNYAHTSAMTAKTDVTIYMGTTSSNSLSDWMNVGTMTKVYTGDLNCTQRGWNDFTLTTPYSYTGDNNLVVVIMDKSGNYDGSSYKFYYASSSNTVNKYIYADGNGTYITFPSNDTGTPSYTNSATSSSSTNYPVTRFCAESTSYTITVNANPTAGGTVSGGGTYFQGTQATLTATANTGYGFAGWQLNGSTVSTDNPYNVTVTADATYTAVFEALTQHNVTVTQATGGTISADQTTAYMGDVITLSATPESGYYFGEWIVKDASQNPITVTNNQFTMPNSDVTVTASFSQSLNVTLVQTAHGTISADQTTGLHPGDHVTLTATPDTDCVFLAWYAYKTGSPRDVVAVISNTTILMPESNVTVQAIFVTQEVHEAQIGSGTNTNEQIPTYVQANYSLTQQIYTAAELENQQGSITKIAYRATTAASTRNLDIYIRHTDQSTFSGTKDWTTMGPSFKVFSGSVTFSTSDWTTITLDTPFEYNGSSNIIICVVDNTGSTSGSSSSFTTFYHYSATNRALCASGTTAYTTTVNFSDIQDVSGTRLSYVNRINITMLVPGSAESLTISPDAINDFSYVEGQGPSETHKLDLVGVDLSNDITVTAPTNFEVCMTENGNYESSLTIPRETSKRNRNVTTWNFDDGLQSWTAVDADGDGQNWYHNTSTNQTHNESSGGVTSASYYGGALTPDNWLISPQVTLGGTFTIWACPQDAAWPQEHFGIFVSTTDTQASSFTMLGEWTCEEGVWKTYTVDLRLYAGQTGYLAVRHFNCTDKFRLNVDDFELDTDATITIEMPVTITPATVFVRMKDNLTRGNYSGTLTATDGTVSSSVSLSGVVTPPSYAIRASANPTEGGTVSGDGTFLDGTQITVSASPIAPYSFINWTENGTVVSTDASYTFTVNGSNRTLVANFGFIKHITGYGTGTGNWYLIASPIGDVDPTNVTNMLSNNYDLFYFDQAKENEWVNHKPNTSGQGNPSTNSGFGIEKGKGYLYANSIDVDLVFTGAAHVGTNQDGTETVELAYTSGEGIDLPGWNLVGNPFAETAYLAGNRGFYTMDEDGIFTPVTNASIESMEGIFVVAEGSNESVTFTTSEPTKGGNLALNLSNGRKAIDRAIVRFDGGRQLPKLQLFGERTKLYIPVEGQDYAIVNATEMGEMPVSFKAESNGSYTLSFNAEEVSFAYLHLIDNMTGADIDLLETPSYSFEAKTTDYESRFKLVFATGNNSNDDNFAFYSNGSFVINNEGNAELQVIDIMGRIVKSESINGCANVSVNGATGVYMLRLVNGDNVKVQKVVVK